MKSEGEKNWPVDFATIIEDMCCQSLCYKKEMKVEGMLAVTLDGGDVMIVKVNKHQLGKNDQFVIPKFTTRDSSESVEPVLTRLFRNINPAHVSVSGLGSGKLVGELVITNSASSGMPQAKLILNEQQIPIGQKLSSGIERTNSPVLSSSNSGTKKSLDSVIAKLHHQTSSGSTSSNDVAPNQNQEPVIVASKTKNTVLTKEVDSCLSEKTNVDNVPQMDVEVPASTKTAKSDGIPHLKQEMVNISERSMVKNQSDKPSGQKVVCSVSKSKAIEEPAAPPMKRQRVESMKYIQFKESLKMNKDLLKSKENGASKDKNEEKLLYIMDTKVLCENESQVIQSSKITNARSTPNRESLNTSSGSARSTPSRESIRIQNRVTPKIQATTGSLSGSHKKKIAEKVGTIPGSSSTTPVRTTAKVKRNKEETQKFRTEDSNDSFQATSKTKTKKGGSEEQIPTNKNTSAVSKARVKQGKNKLTAIKPKERSNNKDEPVKKSMRLSRKADAVAKAADQKISNRVTSRVSKSKFKVISSKASKRGVAQAQAQKIVRNIRSRQQQKVKDSEQTNKRERTKRMCLKCAACLKKEDCGTCQYCLDKPKYGGANTLRQKCVTKQCKIYGLHKT